jgi:hypothetical protein
MIKSAMLLTLLCLAAQAAGQEDLREIVRRSPVLPYQANGLRVQPPHAGWQLGMVSWIAAGRGGLVYLLQRGDQADPIVVLNSEGKVVRSWGKGMFTMPHALRVDAEGDIWTTDAATSVVYKFSPTGKKLMEIRVGGQPSPCLDIVDIEAGKQEADNFCGTTDIAFARNGNVFITDGYANARVLEFTRDGKKVREWGAPGKGAGQFRLLHSVQIDASGVVYVSDRENGRVQRFDLNGKYLGEWENLGRIFSLKLDGDSIWLATQPLDAPLLVSGWLLKLDRKTGKLLGHVAVAGAHGIDVLRNGQILMGPGPNAASPQRLRPAATH